MKHMTNNSFGEVDFFKKKKFVDLRLVVDFSHNPNKRIVKNKYVFGKQP